jgi:hypothetical protein
METTTDAATRGNLKVELKMLEVEQTDSRSVIEYLTADIADRES